MIARRFALATLVAAGALAFAGCGMMDRDKGGAGVMSVPLSGKNEVPPNATTGSGTARVATLLPRKSELHVVTTAHYGFLAPCSLELATAIPRICADRPEGFDRLAFHREFNASIERFFREQLIAGGAAQ